MKKFEGTKGVWSINHWSQGKSGVRCVQLDKDGISYYTGDAVNEPHYGIRSKIKPLEHNNWGSFEGAHIADLSIPATEEGRKEAESNARLIAAAPELLEALQKVVEFHQAGLHLSDPLIKYVYPAINKALGINE